MAKAICVNCGREFEKYNKIKKGKRNRFKRGFNCINCSRKCSREWNGKVWKKEAK